MQQAAGQVERDAFFFDLAGHLLLVSGAVVDPVLLPVPASVLSKRVNKADLSSRSFDLVHRRGVVLVWLRLCRQQPVDGAGM